MNRLRSKNFSLLFVSAIAMTLSACQLELNANYPTPTPTATPPQSNSPTPSPTATPAGSGAMVSVSFFGDTSCALSGAGNVYCWGDNSDGQLGNNTTTNSLTPLQVLGVGGAGFLSNMNYVFAGNAMSCAVSTASNVYCWGGNSSGQLGNNTTIDSHTPVEVLGVGATGFLSGIKTASAGGVSYACALSTAQNVYCWGSNGHGNLGNNTTTDSNTPVEVLGVGGTGF
jgi:alpha-tubulin suppressor-like RCC1 family protein